MYSVMCHVLMYSICHVLMDSIMCHVLMYSVMCYVLMYSIMCHVLMYSVMCHVLMYSVMCHVLMYSVMCHVLMYSIMCHVLMYSIMCHVLMYSIMCYVLMYSIMCYVLMYSVMCHVLMYSTVLLYCGRASGCLVSWTSRPPVPERRCYKGQEVPSSPVSFTSSPPVSLIDNIFSLSINIATNTPISNYEGRNLCVYVVLRISQEPLGHTWRVYGWGPKEVQDIYLYVSWQVECGALLMWASLGSCSPHWHPGGSSCSVLC